MKVEFSIHALERMNARGISKDDVIKTLSHHDFVNEQDAETNVYSKVLIKNNKKYLYRVFVNELKKPSLVITVYRTSKIGKYGY
ncbi:MAG: DUF4258 domain-containing protein [Tangfeifania sp.]